MSPKAKVNFINLNKAKAASVSPKDQVSVKSKLIQPSLKFCYLTDPRKKVDRLMEKIDIEGLYQGSMHARLLSWPINEEEFVIFRLTRMDS